MMKFIWVLCFFVFCYAANDFITKNEYAKMLYQNPRGIGCDKCHGGSGEGLVIAKYKERNKQKELVSKELVAPRINNLDFQTFKNSFTNPKNRIMPSYFLTDEEAKLLYEYIIKFNQEEN